jgi:hypothetical protein
VSSVVLLDGRLDAYVDPERLGMILVAGGKEEVVEIAAYGDFDAIQKDMFWVCGRLAPCVR